MAIYKRRNYEFIEYDKNLLLSEVGDNIYIGTTRIYIDLNDRPGLGHNPRLKIMYPPKYSGGAIGIKFCEDNYAIMYQAETGGFITKETRNIVRNIELLDILKRFSLFNRSIILYAHVNYGDQYLHDKVRKSFNTFNNEDISKINIDKILYTDRKEDINKVMKQYSLKGVNYNDEVSRLSI